MMSPVYSEDIMKELGYHKENVKKCKITADIQARCILFKTNYRDRQQAALQINKLEESLKKFY